MKRIESDPYAFPERKGDIGNFEKTMTQQSFAAEVDVNEIVKRAQRTGLLGDPVAMANRQAIFGDFSEIGSYHDAMNRVVAAQGAFMQLPAEVRSRFNNDPGQLCDFMADRKNLEEAVSLGLLDAKVYEEIVKAEKAEASAAAAVPPPPG